MKITCLLVIVGAVGVIGYAVEDKKFPNLERLLDRMGGPTTETGSEEVVTEATTEGHHDRRHWAARLRKSHHPEEGEALPDQDEEDDDEEDDEDEQADIASRRPFTTSVSRPGDWNHFSSKHGTETIWKSYRGGYSLKNNDLSINSEANEVHRHTIQMSRETACRVPQLKVIRVSDHYPSASKVYLPSCTRLHQCAEDTGCCGVSQKCGPKSTKRVELHFFTTHVVGGQGRHHRSSKSIEKLAFYNHTECECQDRTDEMPRDTNSRFTEQFVGRRPGCKCPSEYTVRYLANGSCACDCFDKQRDCTKYKKGKEYFNHQDRICIEIGTCTVPTCDFGAYLRRSGRCPRKHEKFRSWPRSFN